MNIGDPLHLCYGLMTQLCLVAMYCTSGLVGGAASIVFDLTAGIKLIQHRDGTHHAGHK